MKAKKFLTLLLAGAMTLSLAACGGSGKEEAAVTESVTSAEELVNTEVAEDEAIGYTYGEDVTFHSDEPVTYSMMFSDHENYPYQESWRLWSAIEEKTNVTFDMTLIARSDYEDKKSVLINSGDSPYIIPKTYDESKFVDGGQVVAVSDYFQYMPNFQKNVREWNMEGDLKEKMKGDGKIYVLPGLWETAGADYSIIVRKDVFEAAGVDVAELEKTWTWEDFYDACLKVKEHTGCDYVISDCFKGEALLKTTALAYGIPAGWGIGNGMWFDFDANQFYFAETTDNFKAWVTLLNKMVANGVLDPESFSQEDDTAVADFTTGKSFVMSGEYQRQVELEGKMQVDDSELYICVQPGGPAGLQQVGNSRLENGVMIATKALEELGEEGFIKMLRFVDWLWYSDEGHMLTQWGVEGETYTLEDGKVVLNPEITYNGINPDATKKLQNEYGFGGGVFAYGGNAEMRVGRGAEGNRDFHERVWANREARPLNPPIMGDEMETEEMNLISTPLVDNVKAWYMKFITGQADIEADWDKYVQECEDLGASRYTDMCNEIFEKTKGILGY